MSSNVQKKKLLFNVIIVLGVIIVVGLIYWGGSSLVSYWNDRELRDSQRKIELYESKIKTLNENGVLLNNKIHKLDREIDSLIQIKQKTIYIEYEKKVNDARRNTAVEHAKWMDSVVNELKNNSHDR